ncbi:GGDEF domain-containing protein [Gallaecimonas sp. GXIMD4217]|uniref:GGDEF domain-containing protein n=1 Tax=Gallaecimonas sp. GXIMD4217 TaxID=3131927 RepID=UPI00311B0B27
MVESISPPQANDHRRQVLRAMLIFVTLSGALFTVTNFRAGHVTYAMMEFVLVLFSSGLLLSLRRIQNLDMWSFLFLASFSLVVCVGVLYAPFRSGLFMWLYVFPVMSYLLLGRRMGLALTALYLLAGMGILVYRLYQQDPALKASALANFSLSLSVLWAMAHVYESRREQMVRELGLLAARDPLTGLNNRLHLDDIFAGMAARARPEQPLSLLLVDVDHFKGINDRHGHQVGDQLLAALGEVIGRSVRQGDHAFRLGGEEFCILLADTDRHRASAIAERLRSQVAQQQLVATQEQLRVTVSIGVAEYPAQGDSFLDLYGQADASLYAAKDLGRNRVSVAGAMAGLPARELG